MKDITLESIQELRTLTDAGIMNCKRALLASDNIDEAVDYLRKKGIVKADEKSSRVAGEGIIESYIHSGSRLGVILELRCETDFAAKTPEFKQLARDIAMQIAAIAPEWVSKENIPKETIEDKLKQYQTQAKESGKPDKIIEKIAQGKLEKFYKEVCLIEQPFIKNSEITIDELVKESVGKLKENIYIKRFARFNVS